MGKHCIACHEDWGRKRLSLFCVTCRKTVRWISAHIKRRIAQLGGLPKVSGVCVDFGKPAKCWDHRSYLRPMSVEPVCVGCNLKRGCADDLVYLIGEMQRTRPEAQTPIQSPGTQPKPS